MGFSTIFRLRPRKRKRGAQEHPDKRRSLIDFIKRNQDGDTYNDKFHDSATRESIETMPAIPRKRDPNRQVPVQKRRSMIMTGLQTWFAALPPPLPHLNTAAATPEPSAEYDSAASMQMPLAVDGGSYNPPKSWESLKLRNLSLTSEDRSIYSSGKPLSFLFRSTTHLPLDSSVRV